VLTSQQSFCIFEYQWLPFQFSFRESAVGKSSLLVRFTVDNFIESRLTTVDIDFKTTTNMDNGKTIKWQIWDTARHRPDLILWGDTVSLLSSMPQPAIDFSAQLPAGL
jgi:hypothetical protein